MSHGIKDYYKTLGISPAATIAEVKAAYRALASKYHPDKAGDNPFAENHFKEISEAYRILGDTGKRQSYDEERWLRGVSTRSRDHIRISAAWLISEAQRLEAHIRSIDTYRMNSAALRDYVSLLLSDEHLSVWEAEANTEDREVMIPLLLRSLRGLPALYFRTLEGRLTAVAGGNAASVRSIRQEAVRKVSDERWARFLPFLALLIAGLICVAILFFGKQG